MVVYLFDPKPYPLGFATFFAGLGLKGAADAALGTAVAQPVRKVADLAGGVAADAASAAGAAGAGVAGSVEAAGKAVGKALRKP